MRRKFVNILALICAFAVACFAIGCKDTGTDNPPADDNPPVVEKISITGKPTGSVNVGAEVQLGYEITPSGIDGVEVEWSSLPADVASITGGGLLKGLKEGSAIVTAKVKDTNIKDSFTVQVKAVTVPKPITDIEITGGVKFNLNTARRKISNSRQRLWIAIRMSWNFPMTTLL